MKLEKEVSIPIKMYGYTLQEETELATKNFAAMRVYSTPLQFLAGV